MNELDSNASDYFVMQSAYSTFTVRRASHLGMCFGVRDAIALALSQAEKQPLTVLGDLVHNESVVTQLRNAGVQTQNRPADVQTAAVMITAHGASDKTLRAVREHGLHVLEATCPLVHFAHRAVKKLAAEGCHPVIIGQRGHVEVRGLTEDLNAFDIVLTDEDVAGLTERSRFGVAAQTTQPIDRVCSLVDAIRKRFPHSEVRFIDTVCQPTKLRQKAAIELAQECDVVIVIGGEHSNNTRELVQTCARYCARVHHVQCAGDLRAGWIEGAKTVGLTAGTSTPDYIIDSVEDRLRREFMPLPLPEMSQLVSP